ncbi:MAG: SMP-30/gluconolactonase/LRE family protein [SAR202 cluster bacterium]|jgi:gluconolactonase|nr:SMP-30/gluconolactonase/LRE family protein [SAR202 cluster bacterium]MDP6514614.1 SMP-30/gluconolactonase/LRE family protein [SAR202 cluster bacterium]MDP6715473.1 SMP-30/gluconolactonase/LRE family protein [SAR202 cluster bacterium]
MTSNLNSLVPNQEPQKLAGDLQFTEGPLWHPDGYLLFSDIPSNEIKKYTPGGSVETHLTPSRNSNGLTFDRDGVLVACEHTGRQVSRQAANGQMEPVATHYDGKRLNSPNDVVVHSSGRIFFTDPPYGIQPEEAEIGFNGVYRIDADGSVTMLESDFGRPNGLAFSPDESILYVDDTERRNVRAFDVGSDFSLSNDRVFIDMDTPPAGSPDGMKVDTEGNLYVTGAGGVWVIGPDASHIGTIEFPELPANVAFGGDDYKTLFVTARTGLYSVQVNVAGIKP